MPLLAHGASLVGDPAVRHRGTIGGSVAHSDPASDLPSVLLALGATFIATSADGRAGDPGDRLLHRLPHVGARADGDAHRDPRAEGAGRRRWNYQKFNRRAQDWAIVGVAAVRRDGHAGIGLVNMGSTPIFAAAASEAWLGGASAADVAELVLEEAEPQADLNASVEYREHLAKVLTRTGRRSRGEVA